MELPLLKFNGQTAWEKWLDKNHDRADGVWLKYAKKNSGETSINHTQAIEAALCYGWIDGLAGSVDEKFYKVKFTPRRPRSMWSKINVEKVEALIKAGKMQPAGLAQVEAAKADGRWDKAYAPQSQAEMPDDFKRALAKNKEAADFFEGLNKANKYAFFWRLEHVSQPEARAAKIQKFIDMLKGHKAFH